MSGKAKLNLLELSPNEEKLENVFTLGDQLGSGAFSTVKRAKHKQSGKDFAIKFINVSKLTAQTLDMLKKEISIQRKINHPRVVNLHDVYLTETGSVKQVAIVLELVTGGELFDKIVELEQYSEEDARLLMKNFLGVLDSIHQHKVIHRDLKPENLLLESKEKPITEVKLADFGLATTPDDPKLLGLSGSPGYIAPEILGLKHRYDMKADMWSAGVILFILLCGAPPYDPDEREFATVPFGPEWKNISKDAQALVRALLEPNPQIRLSAADALAHKWFDSVRSKVHLPVTVEQMKSFNARRKLKKGILGVMAINAFSKKLAGMRAANTNTTNTNTETTNTNETTTTTTTTKANEKEEKEKEKAEDEEEEEEEEKETEKPNKKKQTGKNKKESTSKKGTNTTAGKKRKRSELYSLNEASNSFLKDRRR